jgi:protein NUD1
MPKVRILRLSGNKVQELDVGWFPNLRTLYADENRLLGQGVKNAGRLSKMENLSLRSQSGRGGVGGSGGGGNATLCVVFFFFFSFLLLK